MKKLILIIAILYLFAVCANAQAAPPSDCEVCSQRLEKTLNDLDAADRVIAAKDAEIKAKDALSVTNEAIIANLKFINEQNEKLIEIYRKKSRPTFSILFGLVKIRL